MIVQDDAFNNSRIATTICVILTSNLRLASAPGNVLLAAAETGLPRDSVANVSQLVTLDRRRLATAVRTIDPLLMRRVDDGLKRVLGL